MRHKFLLLFSLRKCQLIQYTTDELVSATNQFKLHAPDGKQRLTDTLDGEGVILLAKAIPNVKAKGFLDWFTYNDNTIDGQSKKKAYQLFESASCKRQSLVVSNVCNRYTLISLEDCTTLLDKFVRRIYPKEVLRLLIVCTLPIRCKQLNECPKQPLMRLWTSMLK